MSHNDPPDNTETAATRAVPYARAPIKDRYRIERELGRGSFGVVYLASDDELDSRPVVIKVLQQQDSDQNEWMLRKFREERQALARIDHPGVVGILDAGQMPDGKPFLVMQFVSGVTLRKVMQENIPLERAGQIVRRIGQALSAAHDRGVLHRDLKPENIMVQDLGEGEDAVKIIDFGIASVRESQGGARMEETRVAGSGPYMAPEQLLAKPSAASDIYALGVIAYELVTGRRPFDPESLTQMYLLQREGIKVKPVELRPELPPAAQDSILRALSFDPGERQTRARDFGEEFARALAGQAKKAKPPTETEPVLEMAHVLYMDIVGYSLLPMEQQRQIIRQLNDIVQSTAEFQRAQAKDELVCLPTGDGMALAFFRDPVSPVQCAVEVCGALRKRPELKLRLGINTGPAYRVADVNANRNVAGGAINMAQRVMDCGDAGHILVSRSVAEVLSQLGQWAPHLHDLGQHEVKHGVRVQVFNLYTEEVGNRELPRKLKPAQAPGRRRLPVLAALIAVAVLLAGGISYWVAVKPKQNDSRGTTALPDHTFQYSILVQKYENKKPHGKPFPLAHEMLFGAEHQIRLTFSSPESGYLYILNEGPVVEADLPSYVMMFPEKDGSALMIPGQKVETDWFVFDTQEGTEKLWMVWAAATVPELDAVKKFVSSQYKGLINDKGETQIIKALLEKYSTSPTFVEVDGANTQTRVRGKGNVFVRLLKLEHH